MQCASLSVAEMISSTKAGPAAAAPACLAGARVWLVCLRSCGHHRAARRRCFPRPAGHGPGDCAPHWPEHAPLPLHSLCIHAALLPAACVFPSWPLLSYSRRCIWPSRRCDRPTPGIPLPGERLVPWCTHSMGPPGRDAELPCSEPWRGVSYDPSRKTPLQFDNVQTGSTRLASTPLYKSVSTKLCVRKTCPVTET